MNQFLHEFVPQDIAKRMRDVKFNEPCLGLIMGAKFPETQILSQPIRNSSVVKTWGNSVVPTYREAFKWLREKHGILISPQFYSKGLYLEIQFIKIGRDHLTTKNYLMEEYNLAEIEALNLAIEYLENE